MMVSASPDLFRVANGRDSGNAMGSRVSDTRDEVNEQRGNNSASMENTTKTLTTVVCIVDIVQCCVEDRFLLD